MLWATMLGFFVVTLDALVVNVVLPVTGRGFGGGIIGLQWVVDGYTLMFAALLLSSGALADRVGARRAFAAGLVVFVAGSAACGLAPELGVLVAAGFVQGAGAAAVLPASLALLGEAFPDQAGRARAVSIWAVGGAVGGAAGPVFGGVLTLAPLPRADRGRRSSVPGRLPFPLRAEAAVGQLLMAAGLVILCLAAAALDWLLVVLMIPVCVGGGPWPSRP